MKKLFSVLALLLLAVPTFAQLSDAATPSLDIEGERRRIQADRTREEARFAGEDAACYARFAVTDCLREVRVRRREVLDDLRRQEVAINDAERKRKAQEQIERIEERSSAQRLEEEATSRLRAREAQQEREDRASQKAAAAQNAKSGQPPGKSIPQKSVEQGRTADEIAEEQKQYKEKLREAQEHRASREKSRSEKSGTPPKPLPPTP